MHSCVCLRYTRPVVNERLMQLLHDCDVYLVRQRTLLLRASVFGLPEQDAVAMDAALDQLAAGVASARDAVLPEDADGVTRRMRGFPDLSCGDPGE
jgi:hypothetical protein